MSLIPLNGCEAGTPSLRTNLAWQIAGAQRCSRPSPAERSSFWTQMAALPLCTNKESINRAVYECIFANTLYATELVARA